MAGHKTIVEALRAHGPMDDNERLYRVFTKSGPQIQAQFAVSNSPAQAALKLVTAQRVTDKDINAALTKAVLEKEEDRGDKE